MFFVSRNRFLAGVLLRCVSKKRTEASHETRLCPCLHRRPVADLQLDALKQAGCKRVFTAKVSAAKGERPGLADAVFHLCSGDVLVVWKLDRLGRTVKGLVDFVADLQHKGGQFRILTDGIDSTTPAGRLFFHVKASLSQMEREMLAERK